MVSVMLYPCMFCIALTMDLFVMYVACLTVFVNYFVVESDGVVVCGWRCSIG